MIRNFVSLSHIAFALVTTTAGAAAQNLNVDLFGNSPATVPTSAYGAAANQPGVWNGIDCTFCEPQQFPLVGLTGQSTGAVLSILQGGVGESCADASLTTDEAALLRSGQLGFDQFTAVRFAISGMEAGEYDLYVYAGKRCLNLVTPVTCEVVVGTTHQSQLATGESPSIPFELDGNCMRFRFQVLAGQAIGLNMVASVPGWFSAQGLQLTKLSPRVLPICFGSNDGFGCPCGPGAWGNGCPSSFEPLGANLTGSGGPSVTADTVVLSASGLSNSNVLFFQGTTLQAQGAGSVFGDGLLCAGGAYIRLAIVPTTAGAVTYPDPNDTPISVRGLVPPGGARRIYQVFYRDSASFCRPDGFNCTNAVIVTWGS